MNSSDNRRNIAKAPNIVTPFQFSPPSSSPHFTKKLDALKGLPITGSNSSRWVFLTKKEKNLTLREKIYRTTYFRLLFFLFQGLSSPRLIGLGYKKAS